MNLKKYFVYIDDGKNVFKEAIPAVNEKAARDYCAGNGEIIAVKDVTNEIKISRNKVFDALKNAGFSDIECDFVVRALN